MVTFNEIVIDAKKRGSVQFVDLKEDVRAILKNVRALNSWEDPAPLLNALLAIDDLLAMYSGNSRELQL